MIGFADKSDIGGIRALWREAFGDDFEYIDFFIERYFAQSACVVYRSGGKVVSMLFLLDAPVRAGGVIHPSKYIYAACTAKEKRGMGIMGELIAFALDFSRKSGARLVSLVPGEQSLFDFYSRLGFHSAFCKKTASFSAQSLGQIATGGSLCRSNPCSAAQTADFRNSVFLGGDAAVWGAHHVSYALGENIFCSGKCFFFRDKPGYVIARQAGDTVFVKECCVAPADFPRAAAAVVGCFDFGSAVFDLPADYPVSSDKAETRQTAMIYPLDKSIILSGNAYFGLPLD